MIKFELFGKLILILFFVEEYKFLAYGTKDGKSDYSMGTLAINKGSVDPYTIAETVNYICKDEGFDPGIHIQFVYKDKRVLQPRLIISEVEITEDDKDNKNNEDK